MLMSDYKDNALYKFHGNFKKKAYKGYELHDDYYPFIFCECKNINGHVKLIVCLGNYAAFINEVIHGNPNKGKIDSCYISYGNSKDEAWNKFKNDLVIGDYEICSADESVERWIERDFMDIKKFAMNNCIGDLELGNIFKSVLEEKW